jgi:nucleoside-diphosphate-sugar epimerase
MLYPSRNGYPVASGIHTKLGGETMRVVIVGATGNIGTSLVEVLATDEQIDAIVGIARRPPRWRPPKTTWVQADTSSDALETHFAGADAVAQLAWIFQPTHDELATWRNNVLGTIRVFEAAARAGVRALVYASSVGAYSPGPQDRGVDESWPTHALPTAAYGREKSYLERVLDGFEHENPDMRVVRLRPGFIFKRESASEQRRLFAGPLLPTALVRPGLLPVVPDLPGLRLQALHSLDAAQAFRLAIVRPVRGAFNVAADPVLDSRTLGELLGARPIKLPLRPIRAALAAAWNVHLLPASPTLMDLALSLPVMDTARARTELGWHPAHTSLDAIREFLDGLRNRGGMDTPPLEPFAGGRLRAKEFATGVGQQATP